MAHQSHHEPRAFPRDVSSSPSPNQGHDSKWGVGRIGGIIIIVLIVVLILVGIVLHALRKRDQPKRAALRRAEGGAATGRTEGPARRPEQGDRGQQGEPVDQVAANIKRRSWWGFGPCPEDPPPPPGIELTKDGLPRYPPHF
ncbi:hypothetical protein B0T10DRAFT_549261 [Thelonectria olida]|uniref:Uncharacterized protein n=1 Tax=Thelonectria olida TaxID=1576542 RepID=A0A9P8W5L2_9HYPO|nr:hypothetical protein B0T10DRAFT_549261 [Thelonectria olida]